MRKPSFLLCVKYPRYKSNIIRENRGTHGVSSLILYSLECLSEKPPPLRWREYVTYWCAARVLTLDRKYAKEILNSIGMSQAVTDKDRAKIALKGRQYTVQIEYLARDLSTNGCFPKAWQRTQEGFRLLKNGGADAVERELLASQICRCFDIAQAFYSYDTIEGANCQTVFGERMTQREAAVQAVKEIGLNQIKEVRKELFDQLPQFYEMFCKRLEVLRCSYKSFRLPLPGLPP